MNKVSRISGSNIGADRNKGILRTIFYFLLFIFPVLLSLRQWYPLSNLKDEFYLKNAKVLLHIEGDINNDFHLPFWTIRAFHNKPVYLASESINTLMKFFSPVFILRLISFTGLYFITAGIYAIYKNKNRKILTIGLLLFAVLIYEMFFAVKTEFIFKTTIVSLPFVFISSYGLSATILNKSRFTGIKLIILLLISLIFTYLFKEDIYYFAT